MYELAKYIYICIYIHKPGYIYTYIGEYMYKWSFSGCLHAGVVDAL